MPNFTKERLQSRPAKSSRLVSSYCPVDDEERVLEQDGASATQSYTPGELYTSAEQLYSPAPQLYSPDEGISPLADEFVGTGLGDSYDTDSVEDDGFTLRDGASLGVGFLPGVGTAQAATELITGRDYISGREASRGWAAVGMVAGLFPGGRAASKGVQSGVNRLASRWRGSNQPSADRYPRDYPTGNTVNRSANYRSEGEARALAREKLGRDPVRVDNNKLRSQDGRWQYRAKDVDVSDNHIHLERLDPDTGEVLENWHLRWPEGASR